MLTIFVEETMPANTYLRCEQFGAKYEFYLYLVLYLLFEKQYFKKDEA